MENSMVAHFYYLYNWHFAPAGEDLHTFFFDFVLSGMNTLRASNFITWETVKYCYSVNLYQEPGTQETSHCTYYSIHIY